MKIDGLRKGNFRACKIARDFCFVFTNYNDFTYFIINGNARM